MRTTILSLLTLIVSMTGMAQSPSDSTQHSTSHLPSSLTHVQSIIGYLSYDSALVSMPQYAIVQQQMEELRKAYQKEVQRVEEEFNQKYEAFLEGQREFPRTILLKRQNELQELIQRNVAFKQQGQHELQKAEEEAMQPLRQQLTEAIAAVAREHRFALVVNTDSNACPYIDPLISQNIQNEVEEKLRK